MQWLLDNLFGKYQRYERRGQREGFRVFYLQIFNYILCLNWFSKELKIAGLLWDHSPCSPAASLGARACDCLSGSCVCQLGRAWRLGPAAVLARRAGSPDSVSSPAALSPTHQLLEARGHVYCLKTCWAVPLIILPLAISLSSMFSSVPCAQQQDQFLRKLAGHHLVRLLLLVVISPSGRPRSGARLQPGCATFVPRPPVPTSGGSAPRSERPPPVEGMAWPSLASGPCHAHLRVRLSTNGGVTLAVVRGHHGASRNVRKGIESHGTRDLLSLESKVQKVPCMTRRQQEACSPKCPHSDLEEGLPVKLRVSPDSRSRQCSES